VKRITPAAESGQLSEPTLPRIGRSKFSQIEPFIGMCRESWRKLGLIGRAPRPIRLTSSCSLYDNAEVHRWIADPAGYRAHETAAEQQAA
jgi:predicted DNA-binding transcriptional regulator AlpA